LPVARRETVCYLTMQQMNNPPNVTILIAEDSEDDRFMYARALEKIGFKNVKFTVDGEDAIAYLKAEGKYANRNEYPFPDWLIVDLKMPRKGGFEVIQWVRSHPECGVIPTIIMTSSIIPADVKRAYEIGVNTFFSKPHSQSELVSLFEQMLKYWCRAEVPAAPPERKCG
jgi:CheY-like chemotaxis protein